jgi:hypothetical protein
MQNNRIFKMSFASVYDLYIKKVERKGKTKAEVDQIIMWLTGYDQSSLQKQIDDKVNFVVFFDQAPEMNLKVSKITGVICGWRVENMEKGLMKNIRYMDKLS